MANLGTLMFGADIDLTNLKQKIQSGNQDILNALKINYDPTSYNQMVSKLKTDLSRETFEIRISTNTQSAIQSVRNSLSGLAGSTANGNLAGLSGVKALTRDILDQREAIRNTKVEVSRLKDEWSRAINQYGKESPQARAAYGAYNRARRDLALARNEMEGLNIARGKASLAQSTLNQHMRNASRSANQLTSESLRLNTTLAGGIHISTQLGSALSSLFAVHAARQFLENVIEIGGQLEKQRISMQAIIGDAAKANDLFSQIKDLAIKSPFGVVELDQYSKQLAAYGIEQSELFDMTKRLADISAGAGQDIGRLALALGHVKSATYLTGITLRQFSMNNIPMLKMLADYYSEVEQRAVSTAEVQKRISKRQVSYDDVVEQFKRMTNEGGRFYNMQEKISESLQAKFKNLRDSFDIMYGEIAESKIGDMLKNFAAGATTLSKNWERVAYVLGIAAIQFGVVRAATVAQSYAMQNLNSKTIATALSSGKLSASMIERYIKTGQITKAQLLQAVSTKKLSVADAELAAAEFGITRAQLERIAVTGRYMGLMGEASLATSRFTVAQLRMIATLRSGSLTNYAKGLMGIRLSASLAGSAIKYLGTALASIGKHLAVFAAISIAMDAMIQRSRDAEEQEERMRNMAETANEAYKNMSEAREKFSVGASKGMKDDELSTNIDEMIEHLKNYQKNAKDTFDNAFAIDSEGKAVHSLKEQYEILAEAIDGTTESYREFNEIRPMVEHAIEAGEDKNLMDYLFSWLPKENRVATLGLKESVEFYAECLNEASKAEQVFLRNRLDVVSVLKNMGIEDAAKMTNDEILEMISEWSLMSHAEYEKFNNLLEGDAKKSFEIVRDEWGKLNVAYFGAVKNLKKSGQDFYESAKVFWGDDMQKWPSNWRNTVMLAMDAATKDIKGFEYMSEGAKNNIRNTWLEPFKIEVDSEEAQQRVNDLLVDLENLVGKSWVVQIGIKGVNSIEDVDAASKAYAKSVKDVESTTKRLRRLEREGKRDSEQYKTTLKNQQDAIAERDAAAQIIHSYGGDLPEVNKKKGGSSNKDRILEMWKDRYDALKSYYDEVQKFVKLGYDIKSAMQKVKDLGLADDKVFGKDEANRENYAKKLRELLAETNDNTAERARLQRTIRGALGDFDRDGTEEVMKKNIKMIEDYISRMDSQWKLYRDVLKKTGNKEFAELAFKDGSMWDDVTRKMLREFNVKGNERGVIPLTFSFDMSEEDMRGALRDANGVVQEDLVKLAMEIKKLIRNNYTDFIKESADAYSKSLSNQEKLNELIRQRNELQQQYNSENNMTDAVRKGYQEQMKALDRQIAAQQWSAFKESVDWGKVFGNLDNVTYQTLDRLLDQLQANAPTINNDVEAVKALYEAIEKLKKAKANRDPFTAIRTALQDYSTLRGYRNQARKNGSLLANTELSRLLGVPIGSTVSAEQIENAMKATEDIFGKGVTGLVAGFKSIQDALQPVIDLFEQLGETGLSTFFQMGSNALGAAAQMGQGATSLFGTKAGPYGAAIGAGLSVLSSVFAMHDEALQEEIEASEARKKEMDNLTKNLEKTLERTLGGIYSSTLSERAKELLNQRKGYYQNQVRLDDFFDMDSTDNKKAIDEINSLLASNDVYKAQRYAIEAQKAELERQMAAEQDKKNSDDSKIADYREQIAELEDDIRNFALDMAKSLYGIDIKSWASSLTDAIVTAWQNGEDAVEAYKKKVKEMMLDLTKNILAQRVLEQSLKNLGLDDEIERLMNTQSGQLDYDSVERIAEILNQAGEYSATTVNAVLDSMESKGYISKGEKKGSSSVSNAIKGITEETADLLASYINAIRADVSIQRVDISFIRLSVEQLGRQQSVIAEAQTQQLRQIADNTKQNAESADAIYRLLTLATRDKAFGFKIQ